MLKIMIKAQAEDDLKIIEDVFRIYFSEVRRGPLLEKEGLLGREICGKAAQPQSGLREFTLCVAKEERKVSLILKGENCCFTQTEQVFAETFQEEPRNRQKRLLRLAVHRLWVQAELVTLSPWGIFGGVRPLKVVQQMWDQGLSLERISRHLQRDFALSPSRTRLLCEVAGQQRAFLPQKNEVLTSVSLYVGIPFCPTRCFYCSFPAFSLAQWGFLLPDYFRGLLEEINAVGTLLREKGIKVQNVYVGGGTPTILSVAQLDLLLKTISQTFLFAPDRELTIEGGRPDTLTREKLQLLKEYQVTRLSINPQTMQTETLRIIGRQHTVQEIYQRYALARKIGFPVINMDLIVGLPGETALLLQENLKKVLELRPENITIHALARKRGAIFQQKKTVLPFPEKGIALLDLVHASLPRAGYLPYYLYRQRESFAQGENVGYSLPAKFCRYNLQMMGERQTIIGLGVGATSKLVRTTDWSLENIYNPKDIVFYLQRLPEIMQRKVDKLAALL